MGTNRFQVTGSSKIYCISAFRFGVDLRSLVQRHPIHCVFLLVGSGLFLTVIFTVTPGDWNGAGASMSQSIIFGVARFLSDIVIW